MKLLTGLLAIVPLGIGASGCGGSSKSAGSVSQSARAPTSGSTSSIASTSNTTPNGHSKDSKDGDNDPSGNSGSDDSVVLDAGRPANEAEMRAVTGLVERYYAAAAANDGTTACSQIYLILREVIPEDYGQAPGPPSLRGKTCAVVMSKFFKQRRRQLIAQNAKLKVTGVRVAGKQGYALLRFGGKSELSEIQLHSELGVWKIDALLGGPFP